MKIEIYVVGHRASEPIPSESVFVPIQVGSGARFCALSDNTGDNIAEKNDSFCELTALYWIWKNTAKQDYVGLFHYRRHLSFSSVLKEEVKWGYVEYNSINERYLRETELNDSSVRQVVATYDVLLPVKWDVRRAGKSRGWNSILGHYKAAENHFLKDYEAAMVVLAEKYPAYIPFAKNFNAGTAAYWCNMFVMRRDLFDRYCVWLFDILFELEKRLAISSYNIQERRVFGYISERLINIFLEKTFADEPNLRIKTLQRTFVEDPKAVPELMPFYQENNIGICMSFGDSFAPYAAVTLISVAAHADAGRNYDIVIFDGGITIENRRRLQKTLKGFPNFNIRYIATKDIALPDDLFIHAHFSKDIYARLFIPKIFRHYDRVIYLDADMIVLKDLAELTDADLGGASIGAVVDPVMPGFMQYKVPSAPYGIPADKYINTVLKLADPASYFNSGLIVFSINEAFKKFPDTLRIVESDIKYWFPDQDILNSVYQNDTKPLDSRWNVLSGNGNTESFFRALPDKPKEIYFKSRADPFIIHYAGENKPWINDKGDFCEFFWQFCRRTPFYETILRHFILAGISNRNKKTRGFKKIKREFRRVKRQMLHFIKF